MLKGVNLQVVEIHDTGNECFRKALLFVNPEYAYDNKRIKRSFQRLIKSADIPKMSKRNRSEILCGILSLLIAAAVGAVLALLFIKGPS